jgi:4-hydroxybenzoate polyprenyltransferase
MATTTKYPAWARDTAGYLFTNRVHVFLMPALLTFFWNLDLRLPLPFSYYLMITASTAAGYIINMYTDRDEDEINYTARYRFFGVHPRTTKAVAALCWLLGFLLSLRAGIGFVLYGGAVLVVASVYGWRFRLGGKHFRIKDVPVVKNLYAGVLWSAALILTPYFYVDHRPGLPAVLIIFISLGANFFVELMWDVRDVEGDRKSGVRTIPVLFGENAAFWTLRGIHVVTCLAMGLGLVLGWLEPAKAAILLILYLPIGLLFLVRYRRLADKVWASNGYLVIAAGIVLVAMIPPLVGGMGD